MIADEVQTRRAHPTDAEAIALAHLDSIRSIGSAFYSPDVVEAWGAGLTPDIYVRAMQGGEAFFIATGRIDGKPAVLGFSTHRVDDAQDGTSVYVRGKAARQGIGTALLRLAEEHARAHGATSIEIQASACRSRVLQGEWIRGNRTRRGAPDVGTVYAVRIDAQDPHTGLTIGVQLKSLVIVLG